MIHIDLKPEPSDFDIRVRQPGNKFIALIQIQKVSNGERTTSGPDATNNCMMLMVAYVHIAANGFQELLLLSLLTIFILKVHILKRHRMG